MKVAGFDWDDGKRPKCAKHGLTRKEIEQAFHNVPAVYPDPATTEERLRAIGQTDQGRFLFIVFVLRGIDGETRIRPISARPMHEKEIRHYDRR